MQDAQVTKSLEGPPIPITIDMVKKAISKMKSGKAAGPSGIVVELIKAADTGATMIHDLATAIIRDGKVPTDSGLEKSTRPLVFTSASGCRASVFFG